MKNLLTYSAVMLLAFSGLSQEKQGRRERKSKDSTVYKKRVLEAMEIDVLTSFYTQDGQNAAVTGGIGTEKLSDFTQTFIVAIPLNDDDVLKVDAGISAYTSASSSNINPFDGKQAANPFVASSGASNGDVWMNLTATYSHSSDDRNQIWSGKASISNEYDYSSVGVGGSYTRLFNEQNTEVSVHGSAYFDKWKPLYPFELNPSSHSEHEEDVNFDMTQIKGATYNPKFTMFDSKGRNSYTVGLGFSQILSERLQGSVAIDMVHQRGLLSTPFQRVYFADVANSYIGDFHLAEDVERLPDTRTKLAVGGRLNYYLNDRVILRGFYRIYGDDWGVRSHTASLEVPVKIGEKFTVYPSYRFYSQTAADYFAPYEQHLSTEQYYTSDYDLSAFNAHQYGFGVSYTDIFTKWHIWKFGLKSLDLKLNLYHRNTGLKAGIISAGAKFVLDKGYEKTPKVK